jgi:hypothetical protein
MYNRYTSFVILFEDAFYSANSLYIIVKVLRHLVSLNIKVISYESGRKIE